MFADVVLIVDTEEQDRDMIEAGGRGQVLAQDQWIRMKAGNMSTLALVVIVHAGPHKYVVVRVAVKLSSGYVSGIGCFVCSNSTSEESE